MKLNIDICERCMKCEGRHWGIADIGQGHKIFCCVNIFDFFSFEVNDIEQPCLADISKRFSGAANYNYITLTNKEALDILRNVEVEHFNHECKYFVEHVVFDGITTREKL